MKNFEYTTYYRGKLVKKDFQGLDFTNSSILHGETVFTSFRTYGPKIPFLADHLKRLEDGAVFLFQQKPEIENILSGIKTLLNEANGFNLRIRITVLKSDFFISCDPLENFEMTSIKLLKAIKIRVPGLVPSFLKSGNYVETNLEVRRAKENGFDDILFLDSLEQITECSTSNIFAIKNDQIYTPAVSGLFLNGITRQKIIEALKFEKIKVNEDFLSYKNLLDSDEIFVCNSVRGIRSVEKVENKEFNKKSLTAKVNFIFKKFIGRNCE